MFINAWGECACTGLTTAREPLLCPISGAHCTKVVFDYKSISKPRKKEQKWCKSLEKENKRPKLWLEQDVLNGELAPSRDAEDSHLQELYGEIKTVYFGA
jgi:hypothetical protein